MNAHLQVHHQHHARVHDGALRPHLLQAAVRAVRVEVEGPGDAEVDDHGLVHAVQHPGRARRDCEVLVAHALYHRCKKGARRAR